MSERREEYTKELVSIFKRGITDKIFSIFTTSDNIYKTTDSNSSAFEIFQEKLKEVKHYNTNLQEEDYTQLLKYHENRYLEKLVEIVFEENLKLLIDGKVRLLVPPNKIFYFKCLLETCGRVYKNPYLLDNKSGSRDDIINRMEKLDSLVDESIRKTIRSIILSENMLDKVIENENVVSVVDENQGSEHSSDIGDSREDQEEGTDSEKIKIVSENPDNHIDFPSDEEQSRPPTPGPLENAQGQENPQQELPQDQQSFQQDQEFNQQGPQNFQQGPQDQVQNVPRAQQNPQNVQVPDQEQNNSTLKSIEDWFLGDSDEPSRNPQTRRPSNGGNFVSGGNEKYNISLRE